MSTYFMVCITKDEHGRILTYGLLEIPLRTLDPTPFSAEALRALLSENDGSSRPQHQVYIATPKADVDLTFVQGGRVELRHVGDEDFAKENANDAVLDAIARLPACAGFRQRVLRTWLAT